MTNNPYTHARDTHVVTSIRIEEELINEYDKLAYLSGRSRNEVICLTLKYAKDNVKFVTGIEE